MYRGACEAAALYAVLPAGAYVKGLGIVWLAGWWIYWIAFRPAPKVRAGGLGLKKVGLLGALSVKRLLDLRLEFAGEDLRVLVLDFRGWGLGNGLDGFLVGEGTVVGDWSRSTVPNRLGVVIHARGSALSCCRLRLAN